MKWALLRATAARWLLPALLVLAVAGLSYSHWLVYGMGKTAQRAAMQSALDKAMQRQARVADELEQERRARRAAEREREDARRYTHDPTGCADVAIPDGVLESFGYRGPRPEVDGARGDAGTARPDES